MLARMQVPTNRKLSSSWIGLAMADALC